jgi:excisionase family DNA binding protein
MKKYKVLQAPASPDDLEKLLNEQAAQGWELVSDTGQRLVFVESFVDIVNTNKTNDMIGFKENEMTTVQAAALAGCHQNTILYHIKTGKLKATMRAGKNAINKADFEAWRKEQNI